MAAADIDEYLAGVEEPKRATLEALRATLHRVAPDGTEAISYGMPALKVGKKVIAGFAAFTNHLAYLPHSGEVLGQLDAELTGYERTKSSLHFAIDEPLPEELVARLVAVRRAEAGV